MRTSATRRSAIAAISVLICLSTACTSSSPMAPDPTRIRAEIKPGDSVRVASADGTTHSLKVSAVGETSLVGSAVKMSNGGAEAAGSRIELPYADIRQIEVQRVSGLKTTAVVVSAALVAAVAIASGGGSHTPGYSR